MSTRTTPGGWWERRDAEPCADCGHSRSAHRHQDEQRQWTVNGSCTYAFGGDDVLCGCARFRAAKEEERRP